MNPRLIYVPFVSIIFNSRESSSNKINMFNAQQDLSYWQIFYQTVREKWLKKLLKKHTFHWLKNEQKMHGVTVHSYQFINRFPQTVSLR